MTEPGEQIIIARGGDGSLGDVSSTRAPKKRQKDANVVLSGHKVEECLSVGLPGFEVVLLLELKSIADVGLLGMPNAKKIHFLELYQGLNLQSVIKHS